MIFYLISMYSMFSSFGPVYLKSDYHTSRDSAFFVSARGIYGGISDSMGHCEKKFESRKPFVELSGKSGFRDFRFLNFFSKQFNLKMALGTHKPATMFLLLLLCCCYRCLNMVDGNGGNEVRMDFESAKLLPIPVHKIYRGWYLF